MNLKEYPQYRETLLYEQSGFVYNTYLCTIPQDFVRLDLYWHDQMGIVYVKKGRGTVTASSRKYPVMAGSIMSILPSELHAIDGDPGARMECEDIIFPLSLLDNQVENDWARHNILTPLQMGTLRFPRLAYADTAMYAEVPAVLDAADGACGKRPDSYSLSVRSSLFCFIFAPYIHRIRRESLSPSPYKDAIKQVLLYVQNHFSELITISDAASLIDYSDAHFMWIFRRETRFTFGGYLSDYRLRYVSCPFRERPDSVGAVALLCGFGNFSYFIRHFRHKYGTSPREYHSHGRQNTKSP